MLKQKVTRCFILFSIGFFISGGFSQAWAQQRNLILSTATTGGTYYPVGVAIATLTSIKLAKKHKITMTAITSAGSGENVQLLKSKEADMAILQGLFGSMAWQGKGKYEGKPQKHLNAVTMLWQNVEHFVVLGKYAKTGNMIDLKNLKGQAFSIGKRGSGTETSGRTILSALGFDPQTYFKLAFLGYTPSANALQDSRVSGMNIPAGPPVGAITQAFASIGGDGLRILDFTPNQLKLVNRGFPVWSPYVIKKGTYPGQTMDVKTIAQPNFMAVNPDVDAEVVYLITKNIYENLPFLNSIHKATKAMALEKAIAGLPVPLHPGAAKFYREKGLKIPKHLIL